MADQDTPRTASWGKRTIDARQIQAEPLAVRLPSHWTPSAGALPEVLWERILFEATDAPDEILNTVGLRFLVKVSSALLVPGLEAFCKQHTACIRIGECLLAYQRLLDMPLRY